MAPNGITLCADSAELSAEQVARARQAVERAIEDDGERHEILLMLGLEPADFIWMTLPGQRGEVHRAKLTLDGEPYEDKNDQS